MESKEILDHQFMVAAYAVTWFIQLSYLGWLAVKWGREKRAEKVRGRSSR